MSACELCGGSGQVSDFEFSGQGSGVTVKIDMKLCGSCLQATQRGAMEGVRKLGLQKLQMAVRDLSQAAQQGGSWRERQPLF